MTHRIQHQLSAFVDDELSPEEMAGVRRHLAECEPCRQELEELRATKTLLGRLEAPPLPSGFTAGVWDRIERRETRRRFLLWPWTPRPALVLAALVLAVVLVGVPVVKGRLDRLRAAEAGPDVFVRSYIPAAAEDPFADRAILGLIHSDAGLRLVGEDPRGGVRARGDQP